MKFVFCFNKNPLTGGGNNERALLSIMARVSESREVRMALPIPADESRVMDDIPVQGMGAGDRARHGFRLLLRSLSRQDTLVVVGHEGFAVDVLATPLVSCKARIVYVPLGQPHRVASWPATTKHRLRQERMVKRSHTVVMTADESTATPGASSVRARVSQIPLGVDVDLVQDLAEKGKAAASKHQLPPSYAVHVGPEIPNRQGVLAAEACARTEQHLVFITNHEPPPATDRVTYVKPDSWKEYYALIEGARVLLSTSEYEANSQALFEALALRVPFISTMTGQSLHLSTLTGCPVVAPQPTTEDTVDCIVEAFSRLQFDRTRFVDAARHYHLGSSNERDPEGQDLFKTWWRLLMTDEVQVAMMTSPIDALPVVVQGKSTSYFPIEQWRRLRQQQAGTNG